MKVLWVLLGMLGSIALTSAIEVQTACRGPAGEACTSLQLSCNKGTIFITSAEYGFKRSTSPCPNAVTDCRNSRVCCCDDEEACYKPYNNIDFAKLFDSCWNRESCSHNVESFYVSTPLCDEQRFHTNASFTRVKYLCLEDDEMVDFLTATSCESKELLLYFRLPTPADVTSSSDVIRTCDIKEDKDRIENVTVTIVRENRTSTQQQIFINTSPCGEDEVSSSSRVEFSTRMTTTPFNISIRVDRLNAPSVGWIMLTSTNDRKLEMNCRSITDPTYCPVPSTAAPTTSSSTPEPETNPASTATTAVGGISPSSRRETTSVDPGFESNQLGDDDTGGVVGAAVGGVVGGVVLIASLAVGVYCYLQRKSAGTRQDAKALMADGSSVAMATPANNQGAGVCNPAMDPEAANPYEEIKDGQLTSLYHTLEDDVNSDVAGNTAADANYDRLRGKQTQTGVGGQPNHYGHLSLLTSDAMGSEGTGVSNYDCLARGSHVTSNVINAYTDAPDPAVTSANGNGNAYNVISFQRQQPDVITGAAYNVAKPVMGSASGGITADPVYFTVLESESEMTDNADEQGNISASDSNFEVAKPTTASGNNGSYEVAKPVL